MRQLLSRRRNRPFTNPLRSCRPCREPFCLSVILVHMGKQNPAWLQETCDFCDSSGIKIVGWGPELLTVEAKSDARASEIASQLGQLGFKPIKDEDNAYAGLLDLSKNPAIPRGFSCRIQSFSSKATAFCRARASAQIH